MLRFDFSDCELVSFVEKLQMVNFAQILLVSSICYILVIGMSSDIEADSCADAHWEYEHYPAFMFKFMHLI